MTLQWQQCFQMLVAEMNVEPAWHAAMREEEQRALEEALFGVFAPPKILMESTPATTLNPFLLPEEETKHE